jgi:uncharacterized protein YxjI
VVVVVAPQYCLPHELSLAVTKNLRSSSRGDWTIRDPEGNILFKVDGTVRAVASRRDLLDDKGYKLIHMQRKRKFLHPFWHMYTGDSDQLICKVKKSTNVFLASNTTETPDFTVEGNFFKRNLKILRGQQAIAQVTPQATFTNAPIDKDTFGVTVFPGGDYAFVIALLVIVTLDAIYCHNDQ